MTTTYSSVTPVVDEVAEKIMGFAELEAGWHFGEGRRFELDVQEAALRILDLGRTIGLKADAFPGDEGDITVSFYAGERSLDVEVLSEGRFSLVEEEGVGAQYREVRSLDVADQETVIEWIKGLSTWHSHDFSILSSSIPIAGVLRATHSDRPRVMEESPWSTSIASESDPTTTSAATYGIITAA